jgi:predicted aspartyl protease
VNVHFNPRRGPIALDAELRGPHGVVRVRLLLDTGAELTMIDREILGMAGYDLSSPRSYVRIATASRVESAPLYILDGLAALGHQRHALGALAQALPFGPRIHGLLGLNFLRGGALTIDFRSGEVTLDQGG